MESGKIRNAWKRLVNDCRRAVAGAASEAGEQVAKGRYRVNRDRAAYIWFHVTEAWSPMPAG
jgi:hypothetical protein